MPNITGKKNVDEDGDCQSRSFPDMCRPHSEYQKDDMRSSYSEPRDLNTKRFKQMLIYFDMDTQYASFWENHLCQATKQHLTDKQLKIEISFRIPKDSMRRSHSEHQKGHA